MAPRHKGQNMQMRFKYLVEDVDRYGNVRLYVRMPGRRKVRLRANFGTDEFLAAYAAAVAGHLQAPRQASVAKRGSFRHLCIHYYASATFHALDRATQSWRRPLSHSTGTTKLCPVTRITNRSRFGSSL